jgi:hypothetical protein
MRRVGRALLTLGAAGERALSPFLLRRYPDAPYKPPWERSFLEDITIRRPWNIAVKLSRERARLRRRRRSDGVTVVIVNWNTKEILEDVLAAVRAFSSPDTKILVVDNGSSDGSREMLRQDRSIDTIFLWSNAGHGAALDLGICAVQTRVAVTLDSDAIPFTGAWLAPIVEPVRKGEALLAGQRSSRDFVHPVYAAVDVDEFLRRRLSFQTYRLPGLAPDEVRWGENAWDTGELLTARLLPAQVHFVEGTDNPVGGLRGSTVGGVAYHHGGVTRTSEGALAQDALAEWRDACDRLGLPGRATRSVATDRH